MVHSDDSSFSILIAAEEDFRVLVERASLGERFRNVTFAPCDAQLIATLRRSRKPDLIFVDASVAGRDCHKALRRIRSNEELASIPIVAFIAPSTLKEDIEHLQALGVSSYMRKPMTPHEWMQCLEEIIPK